MEVDRYFRKHLYQIKLPACILSGIMNIDFQNRYLRITVLWVLISFLLGLLLYFIFMITGLSLPMELHVIVSMLAGGYIVYRFFAIHLG